MSWISALTWPQWLMLGLVPPLILMLYFLKLRRTPVEVPSTYLWTRAIEDLHVNSIWQRLRNSLLLFLQLLFAFLLLMSCLRPGCPGEELAGERFIFLVDQSASMSAVDAGEQANVSRLVESKKQIGNLIDRMKGSDAAMIISFSDRSNVVQSYTTNKSLLKRKLKTIQPTERGTDMREALVAAAGLANPGRTSDKNSAVDVQVADALAAKMFIFTDGGVGPIPDFSLGENLQAEYRPMGGLEPPNNVGVIAFSVSDQLDGSGSGVQAFASLQNSDDEDRVVGVTLYADGELFDANANVAIDAESDTRLKFDLQPLMENIDQPIRLRLEIDDKDVYAQDNKAFAVLNPPRQARVMVVTESNRFLQFASQTDRSAKIADVEFQPPSYMDDKQYKTDTSLGTYDLVIFDQCRPESMPLCNTMFLGALPADDRWKFGDKASPTAIIDTDLSHPLMYSIGLDNVTIVDSFPIEGPPGMIPLIDSTMGTIAAIGPRSGFEDLVIGFPLITFDDDGDASVNTDWPTKLSFPLFMQNVLQILGGGDEFRTMLQQEPGKIVTLRPLLPYPSITVRAPDKSTAVLRPRKDNSFSFANTNKSGIYEVVEPETKTIDQLFAVNLMSRRESNLAVRDKLEIGYEEISGSATELRPARKEYWPWIIAVALGILMLEWIVYNKRVFI